MMLNSVWEEKMRKLGRVRQKQAFVRIEGEKWMDEKAVEATASAAATAAIDGFWLWYVEKKNEAESLPETSGPIDD